jgi:phytoene desaturase
MRIIVVGSGFGGLSAAALLSYKGFDVTVLEKNEQPGGRARIYSEKGFAFDMGPSWYLMPDVFEKFFAEFGRKPEDYYDLIRIDPSYRIFWEDSGFTDVSASLDENLDLFDTFEEDGGEKLRKYLEKAERHYRLAMDGLIYREYSSIRDLLSGRLLLEGLRLPLFSNIDGFVSGIFRSERSKKILEYSIGFIGGSPQNTPALYYIMNHVDFKLGVWYPAEGGIGRVVKAFHDLAVEKGAEFNFNTNVKKIEVQGRKATKVLTDVGSYDADAVIVNADYPYAELELLDAPHRTYDEKYWESRVIAPSALVIYVGLDKRLEGLEHHNLYLAGDWEKEFESIFDPKKAVWPETASYYVNVTSKTDPTVSPEGGETLFVLVPLAPDLEDTEEHRKRYYMKIMGHLETLVDEPILGHEVVKRIFCINDFKEDYNAYKGTALGLTHTLRQTALFRPSHRSRKVENLYYTGHYTHPGIGMPMAIISSQILSDSIVKEHGKDTTQA